MKNNKGITLIALIITIIVMLILAVVTINMVIGEDGVITRTEEAKIAQEKAAMKEKIELAVSAAVMKGNGKLTWTNLQWGLDNQIENNDLKLVEERLNYYLISNESNTNKEILYEYTVNKDRTVEEGLKLIKANLSDGKFEAELDETNLIATKCKYIGTDVENGELEFPNYIIDNNGDEYLVTQISPQIEPIYNNIIKITMPKDINSLSSLAAFPKLKILNISGNGNINNTTLAAYLRISDIEYANFSNIKSFLGGIFANSKKIKNVVLSEKLVKIEEGMFAECYKLNEIILPKKLNEIGNQAFRNCDSLKSIIIPSSVINIGENIFSSCNNLTKIEVEQDANTIKTNLSNLSEYEGKVYDINGQLVDF